jgi:hypothetical protein
VIHIGGVSLAGPAAKFFFTANSCTDETTFLTVLSALEDTFIAAYMAAVNVQANATAATIAALANDFPGALAKP